jgi:hypothetical protein
MYMGQTLVAENYDDGSGIATHTTTVYGPWCGQPGSRTRSPRAAGSCYRWGYRAEFVDLMFVLGRRSSDRPAYSPKTCCSANE